MNITTLIFGRLFLASVLIFTLLAASLQTYAVQPKMGVLRIPAWASAIQRLPKAEIDTTGLDQGYFMCRYLGDSDKVCVQVKK